MTITLIDSANRAGIGTKNDALESKLDGEAPSEPSEFGQLMSDILETRRSLEKKSAQQVAPSEATQQALNGQEIAAQTQSSTEALGMPLSLNSPGQDFLKTVILGPHLNAITPETAAPDEQSLEAFARSQGLDETAVQWLMGTPGPGASTAQAWVAESLKSPTDQILTDSSTPAMGGGWAILMAQQNLNPTPSAGSEAGAATPSGVLTSAALWAMAQPTEKANSALPTTATEATDIQIHFMRSPPPAALWMQGNTLVNSPGKESLSHKSTVSTSELDLSELASDELLTKLTQMVSIRGASTINSQDSQLSEGGANADPGEPASPLSGHPGHRMDLSTTARQEGQNTSSSSPEASLAQRSETIQNLSEKMGQAVGRRILSEIEKGQWHLKLLLRPATLGHIEVEIRMRSGEMDALFTAPQALTRELLQDGLSKLKDTLSQMGMDVASMQVGDGQTQQRGGDSTPSQTSKVANSDSKESKSTEIPKIDLPRTKMGKDGWDVLV